MLSGLIIAVALVLGGLAVMRFGIFQIRKFKKGETKVTKKISEQIAFVVFFIQVLNCWEGRGGNKTSSLSFFFVQ